VLLRRNADTERSPTTRPIELPWWYGHHMAGTYPVVMGDRGRVVIPAELRERLRLEAGSPLILLDTPGGLILATREQLLKLVREDLQGLDLVGELIAERRRQAALEEIP